MVFSLISYWPTMEISAASWAAVSLVFVSIIARWAWSFLDWVWFTPKRLEKCFREQGLQGNSYRFLYGDTKEISLMLKEAKSKPMDLSTSHDIAPRLIPFVEQSVKTYGESLFVWYGPTPRVIITNPEDVKGVLTNFGDFPKTLNPVVKLIASGIASYEGDKWTKHRRIVTPTFHLEKLKKMLPAFSQSCDDMIKEWERVVSKEGSSGVLDVWPSIENLTADVISRTAFGSSFEEGRKIFELLKEQAVNVVKRIQSVPIPGWRFLPTKLNRRMKQIDKEINSLIKGIINKREKAIKEGETPKDDLLGALMESNLKDIQEHGKNNKNSGMSIEDIIEECKLFYFAGQGTTAELLLWTLVLLGQNQNWQNRAREEVLQVLGSKKPDFDGISHLKVVTMILLEVLRLYPAVIALLRTTHKETQVGKYTLPAGVEVGLYTLLIQHGKELWGDDANEFNPERFSQGVSRATKGQLFSYFPFGGGARICIGQNFAMMEAKLALSLILKHFTFELAPSYVHAPAAPQIEPQYGAPVILHKRLR